MIDWFIGVPKSVWDAVDGAKTYIAGAVSLLTGAAGILQELAVPLAAHSVSGVWSVIKGLPHDNSWLMIVGGLTAVGLRHSQAKAVTEPGK